MEELSSDQKKELSEIFKEVKVEKERFNNGIIFATLILRGESKRNAYYKVFKEANRDKAYNLWRTKWVQGIVSILKIDDEDEYRGLGNLIVEKMRGVLDDPLASPSEQVQAAKALQPYALMQSKREEEAKTNIYIVNLLAEVKKASEKGILIEGVLIE